MAVNSNAQQDIDVDLGRLFVSLASNWLRILIVAIVVAGVAFALASLAKAQYKAETRILIETREIHLHAAGWAVGS